MRVSYPYVEDGYDFKGRRLPAIPVLWLELSTANGRLRGPCLVDTGFDGMLYANDELALLLEGVEPTGYELLYAVGGREVKCEVFKVEGSLISEDGTPVLKLGELNVLVPMLPENLSYEVIAGRGVLNRLTLKLNGQTLEVL